MTTPILAISYFFHLVATVVWIGGLMILSILVYPEARRVLADSPALHRFFDRLRKRFMPLTHFSLAVLVVTGLLQMSGDPNYDGVLQFANTWSRVILLKHIAIGGMLLCGLVLQYGVMPALERTGLLIERGKGDSADWERLRRNEIRLTTANLVLGVGVLGFSAWATAL
jgi:uncharacterized membrane protein